MIRFSFAEISQIDEIWRSLPVDHSWSGWAMIDAEPSTVWLYRQRQNWRRFILAKRKGTYTLTDDLGKEVGTSRSLPNILCDIEAVPGLAGGGSA